VVFTNLLHFSVCVSSKGNVTSLETVDLLHVFIGYMTECQILIYVPNRKKEFAVLLGKKCRAEKISMNIVT